VRAHPNDKALLPAQVHAAVWREVSTALLERRRLRVSYLSRSKAERKELLLHPAGLVSRHSISYLIGTVDGYGDLSQFAMHRIQQAECLEVAADCSEPLVVDHYIRNGLNASPLIDDVELVADVSPQIAWLLKETLLSTDQSLEPLAEGDWQRLRARVPQDQETLWWIFGLNDNIQVHEPTVWQTQIRSKLELMRRRYEATAPTLKATP